VIAGEQNNAGSRCRDAHNSEKRSYDCKVSGVIVAGTFCALMSGFCLVGLSGQGGAGFSEISSIQSALTFASQVTGKNMDDFEVLHSTAAESLSAGGRTRHVKLLNKLTGTIVGVSIAPNGRTLAETDFDRQERAAKRSRYGKLDIAVTLALRNASESQRIPVSISFDDSAYEPPPQPDAGSGLPQISSAEADAILQAALEKRRAFMKEHTAGHIARLRTLDPSATGHELSPSFIARLTPAQLRTVSTWSEVARISSIPMMTSMLKTAKQVTGYEAIHQLGFNGGGVRVAQVEVDGPVTTANPYLSVVQGWKGICNANTGGGHSTAVAGAIRSIHTTNTGAAPGVLLWAGGHCSGDPSEVLAATIEAVNWGASSINQSWGDKFPTGIVSSDSNAQDSIVINSRRTVISAAGNNGDAPGAEWVTNPASSYNGIAVGSFDDKNTVDWSDDVMSPWSAWKNPSSNHGDREKPEIVAPGTQIYTTSTTGPWFANVDGTSIAAPLVTGTTALMMQASGSLTAWPEAVRAILIASAVHNIEGSPRLSDKDGAGGLVSQAAVDVARGINGGWKARSVDCTATGDIYITVPLLGGKPTRFVLAFDSNPSYANYANLPSADLDLQILDPHNASLGTSASYDNTFEIVTATTTTTGSYTFKVTKHRCELTPRWMAVAWYQQ